MKESKSFFENFERQISLKYLKSYSLLFDRFFALSITL